MGAVQTRLGLRAEFNAFVKRHKVAWDLSMAGLAVLHVVVGFLSDEPGASTVYGSIDVVLTVIFVAGFASRFAASCDRRAYLRGHWIDAGDWIAAWDAAGRP